MVNGALFPRAPYRAVTVALQASGSDSVGKTLNYNRLVLRLPQKIARRTHCEPVSLGLRGFPCEIEPLAQCANALDNARTLPVKQVRIDRVNSAAPNRGNGLEAPPRLRRFAAEASRDDRFGPRVENLLAGDKRRERFCCGENIAPTANAKRVADEVRAVHGEHGTVPDFDEYPHATLPRVALAQVRDLAFELPSARFGNGLAARKRADQANDAGDIGERAYLGDEDPDAEAFQPIDLQWRIAALPSEDEIRTQGNQPLDIDPTVACNDGQPRRLGRMAAEARDACEACPGTRGEDHFRQMRCEGDHALRRTFEQDGDAAVIGNLQRVRARRRPGYDRERKEPVHRRNNESTAANAASSGSWVRQPWWRSWITAPA